MPLVVELLFADADPELIRSCKAATGRYATGMAHKMHLLYAEGLYEELQRQLDKTDSTLRSAGSAFGILAELGTSMRLLGKKEVTEADLPDMMALCATQDCDKPVMKDADLAKPLCEKVERSPKVLVTVRGCRATREGPVPKISNFPGEWYNIPFSWWTSFAPEPCRSLCSVSRMKAVVICESRCSPHLQSTCEPARLMGVSHGDVASVYEAGSGGWPLCVPQAYCAFRFVRKRVSPGPEGVTSSAESGETTSDATLVPNSAPRETAFQTLESKDDVSQSPFHHVSVEADDDELTLLLATSNTSDVTDLCSWSKSSRIVVPRANVSSSRLWSNAEVISCWSSDLQISGGPGYHNWVEITCTPRNAPDPMSLMLALPSIDIAQRLHDAFHNTPRPPKLGGTESGERNGKRGALICELQLLAKVELSQEGQVQNCSMSMRRSICEAMGISRDRVQVLSVKEGGGSIIGWAAVQWAGFQKALNPNISRGRPHPQYLDV